MADYNWASAWDGWDLTYGNPPYIVFLDTVVTYGGTPTVRVEYHTTLDSNGAREVNTPWISVNPGDHIIFKIWSKNNTMTNSAHNTGVFMGIDFYGSYFIVDTQPHGEKQSGTLWYSCGNSHWVSGTYNTWKDYTNSFLDTNEENYRRQWGSTAWTQLIWDLTIPTRTYTKDLPAWTTTSPASQIHGIIAWFGARAVGDTASAWFANPELYINPTSGGSVESTIIGYNSIGASIDTLPSTYITTSKFQATISGNINTIVAYCRTSSTIGLVKAAIYNNSNVLMSSSNAATIGTVAGWQTFTLSSTVAVTLGLYYKIGGISNATLYVNYGSGSVGQLEYQNSITYPTLPATLIPTGNEPKKASMYGIITEPTTIVPGGTLFNDSFENGTIWDTYSGLSTITSTISNYGNFALQFSAIGEFETKYVQKTITPTSSSLHVRFYLNFSHTLEDDHGMQFLYNNGGSVRAGLWKATDRSLQLFYYVGTVSGNYYYNLSTDTWYCLEFEYNPVSGTHKVYLNGNSASPVISFASTFAQTISTIQLRLQDWGIIGNYVFDDVVISESYIGTIVPSGTYDSNSISISTITAFPSYVIRNSGDTIQITCNFTDPYDDTVSAYNCVFYIRDVYNNTLGPFSSSSLTKVGSTSFQALYNFVPTTEELSIYAVRATITKI